MLADSNDCRRTTDCPFLIADTSHTVYDAVKQLENRNQCSCPPSHTAVVHAMQAISLALVAYATFAHQDASLESAVSTKALQMPGAFDPPAIANTLWALALPVAKCVG